MNTKSPTVGHEREKYTGDSIFSFPLHSSYSSFIFSSEKSISVDWDEMNVSISSLLTDSLMKYEHKEDQNVCELYWERI